MHRNSEIIFLSITIITPSNIFSRIFQMFLYQLFCYFMICLSIALWISIYKYFLVFMRVFNSTSSYTSINYTLSELNETWILIKLVIFVMCYIFKFLIEMFEIICMIFIFVKSPHKIRIVSIILSSNENIFKNAFIVKYNRSKLCLNHIE